MLVDFNGHGPLPNPRDSHTHTDVAPQHTLPKTAKPFLCGRPGCMCGGVCLRLGIYHELPKGGGVDWSTVSLADGNDEKCLL